MKIVHCGNYDYLKYGNNFYCPDYKIHNGLVRNGWYVYPYSYRDEARKNIFASKRFGIKRVNENLLRVVETVRPDLLLLGHSELISVQTLATIKEKFGIAVVMWWVDSFDEEKIGHIRERLSFLDAFFTTTDAGYVRKRLQTDFSNIYYFPNICDDSLDRLKNFEKHNLRQELLYIGKIYEEKRAFFTKLQHSILALQHFDSVYGARFYDTLAGFAFGLNYSKYNDIPKYSSDRIIYLTANGLLTFCPRIPDFTSVFTEEEVLYFSTIEELEELYQKALKDREWAMKIAYNGWRRAHEEYETTKVMRWLVERSFEAAKGNR